MPGYGDGSEGAASQDGERSSDPSLGWVGVVVFVAVMVVILSVALSQAPPASLNNNMPLPSGPAYPVNVTVIDLQSSDNACGLNGTTEPGFLGVTNVFSGETWQITGPPGGCTINGMSAITSGFLILDGAFGPQTIPANQTAPIQVSFDMQGLGGPYTGPLVLSIT